MQYSFTGTRPPSPPPYYTESDRRGQQVPVPRRDPDFWFEDGNVVVIADSTSFRIHRSVLARHSGLLADRLGSDHGHRETTSDGCPVIRVPDTAKSFRGLLGLLYPGPSEILRQVAASTPNRLLPRVTHKYLHGLLPTTFDEWKRRQDHALSPGSSSAPYLNANSDRIGVLNALRQIHADDLLPIALYLCAQLPPRLLFPSPSPNPSLNPQRGSTDRLSRADAERCLRLREALVKHSARMAMRLFADPPSPAMDARCREPRTCRRAVAEAFDAVVRGEFEDAPRTDPLGAYWRVYIDGHGGERGEGRARGDKDKDQGWGLGVCARCAGVLRERDEEQRRELWDELPRLVGF